MSWLCQQNFSRISGAWLLCNLVLIMGVSGQDPAASKIEFNRDIRPILSDNCYACHGPDENQRQADLRLDSREGALADLGGYWAIKPGSVDESTLVERIMSDDPDYVMPPADHRKKLTAGQKQMLKTWIEQGADWQQHWAWIPPRAAPTPRVSYPVKWARNYIDEYILARLVSRKIDPSDEADRRTLIRRLYFDLLGLPPQPHEVAEFLNDTSPDAYEKLVDRLLDSPHFGERMAVYWLDLVRYADTVGYHGDQDVSVSPFRDYVIQAFNQNMPFDQFTREQLAGDLIPDATLWQKVASGYNRLGMMSAEGGVQPEEYLAKYAADRVRTTASVWMGVTMGCAECHDHKFDPYSMQDFYRFASFFADIKERGLYSGANQDGNWGPRIEVADPELADLLKPIDQQLAMLRSAMSVDSNPDPELAAKIKQEQSDWEADIISRSSRWQTVAPAEFRSHYKTAHKILDDDSILMTGPVTDEDVYYLTLELPAGDYRGIRIEALPHASLPRKGPGRAGNGNFVISELIVLDGNHIEATEYTKIVRKDWSPEWAERTVPLRDASATFEQADGNNNPYKKWAAAAAIDHDRKGYTWGWAVMPQSGKENELVARFQNPISIPNDQTRTITVVLHQYHGRGNHVLGRFRVSLTETENPVANPFQSLPDVVRRAIQVAPPERTPEQLNSLRDHYLQITPRFEKQRAELAQLTKQREELVRRHTRTSLITQAVDPREMRVLPRGNWMDKSGPVVQPQFPVLFGADEGEASERMSRADLAEWMVSDQNPLTARVFVNRLWKLCFGTGISKVLDDIGSQGEWPSHPELLDRLAIEFVDSGWDVKQLVKQMVTSATYRQSSAARPELREIDPYNRLLARQSRFRLDAEFIRDNALAVSGLLVSRIGGRSVKPYQPAGLYRHLNFPRRTYTSDTGESQYRRGVYTHWQRQFLHPQLKAFDAPAREECTCERPRSNTPTAALVLLNDPTFIEAARSLATLAIEELETTDNFDPVNWMMQRALARDATQQESELLARLFQSHLQHYSAMPAEARELVSIGNAPLAKDVDPVRLAAWTSVARTIMNTHEFVTRN